MYIVKARYSFAKNDSVITKTRWKWWAEWTVFTCSLGPFGPMTSFWIEEE